MLHPWKHRVMILCGALVCGLNVGVSDEISQTQDRTIHLFNRESLAGFYTFLKDRGRDVDPKGVFSVKDGILRISGEEMGCLTTEAEHENYHLIVEFRWGDGTYAPREKAARDSGILLHSTGADGAYAGMWMHSIECQIIEGGTGDFIVVGDGTDAFSITCPAAQERQDGCPVFQPDGASIQITSGRVNWYGRDPGWKDLKGFRGARDVERQAGEWNQLECLCQGEKITVVLNGQVVNQCSASRPSRGRIQVQSEGAEIFIRRLDLIPLDGGQQESLLGPFGQEGQDAMVWQALLSATSMKNLGCGDGCGVGAGPAWPLRGRGSPVWLPSSEEKGRHIGRPLQ